MANPFPVVLIFVALALVVSICFLSKRSSDPDEGIDIEAEKDDGVLKSRAWGAISMLRHGTYQGRNGESAEFIVRYTALDWKSVPRAAKTIFRSKAPYLSANGHYTLYQFFSEDGSLESDKLIYPEPRLGGGVLVKERRRYFDAQSRQKLELYIREDGSLGVYIDFPNDVFRQYRQDGTLRFEQRSERQAGKDSQKSLRRRWFRKDGKTIWYECGPDGRTRVYFDNKGNPVEKEFTSQAAADCDCFVMAKGSEPRLLRYDFFWRKDGTLAYKQSWFAIWDETLGNYLEAIGALEIYDSSGSKPVVQYSLELRPEGQPRFITKAVILECNGGSFVRTYRAPHCREKEQYFENHDEALAPLVFDESDHFTEPLEEHIFHGFGHRLYRDDDDSHDV